SLREPATTKIYTLSLHDALPIYQPLRESLLKVVRKPNHRVETIVKKELYCTFAFDMVFYTVVFPIGIPSENPVITDETTEKNRQDRKSTRLNSSHVKISYAVFCL